ncbi:hypothetical protein Ddye_024135 [Dipteronia dyeriana]|uniref:Uncharacterized protein n=1 Tax=Dipteronia dyeriana TaxID=168575 RepID=A0AAD9TUR2_9ROSI|nr:hypothetical protein Ddye_024135 [Dipteronia dyeriana]
MEFARERARSKWLKSPYTDLFRAQKSRNIGIYASVSHSFFKELEDPNEWLGTEHMDAYLHLLCKRKRDPVEDRILPRKVAVVDNVFFVTRCFLTVYSFAIVLSYLLTRSVTSLYDSLSNIWKKKNQPDFHEPLSKSFDTKDFEVLIELITYAIGEKPDWGAPWDIVDDVCYLTPNTLDYICYTLLYILAAIWNRLLSLASWETVIWSFVLFISTTGLL